jgi:hypothetical protein
VIIIANHMDKLQHVKLAICERWREGIVPHLWENWEAGGEDLKRGTKGNQGEQNGSRVP